jgi:hypothetical protein
MRLFETYVILSRLVPGSIYTYTNVTITHMYAVFYIGNQDLNLFFLRILGKDKKYAFVLENYLQMIYPSFLCMMIRNVGQNNGYLM